MQNHNFIYRSQLTISIFAANMPDQILIEKFLRFCIIGFIGFAIDFGTTYSFKEKLKLNKYLSNSAGFVFAASTNFFLNRYFTFRNEDPEMLLQFFKFAMVAVVGLGLNNLFVFLFTDKVKLNFYKAKVAAVAIVLFWNFGANNFFTFG